MVQGGELNWGVLEKWGNEMCQKSIIIIVARLPEIIMSLGNFN